MNPLITVAELRALEPAPVLADVTWNLAGPPGKEAYDAGHIPGAYFVDLDTELAAPPGPGRHPLPDATTVTATFYRLGITSADTPVVVYDANNAMSAARAWWTFRYFGLTNVRVLDGGLAAWQSAGGDLTAEAPTGERGTAGAAAGGELTAEARTGERGAAGAAAGGELTAEARTGERGAAGAAAGAELTAEAPTARAQAVGVPAAVSGAATEPSPVAHTGLPSNSAGGDGSTGEVVGGLIATPGHIPVLDADGAAAVAAKGILLDARAPERFAGEVEPMDPVAGHIPGAVNAPTGANVTESGHFRPPAELRERFTALGITDDTEVAVYCGSGVTAAHEALALESAGIPATVYIGSWSEWITDPTRPVATGPN
ncbi:sulfurtransferase [Kribbella sp. NPDC004536]|uniref:sulfurtransferase n=1 Tax=Kribbella sp. NPDC004536 TaxID=3364106 RepID=UPI0036D0B516